MSTENLYPAYPQPGLRVEATWHERPDWKLDVVVVEVNDRPVTPELVSHVVTALVNASGGVDPALITAQLVDRQPVMEGGMAR